MVVHGDEQRCYRASTSTARRVRTTSVSKCSARTPRRCLGRVASSCPAGDRFVSGIYVEISVPQSPQGVWEELRHIERHVNWMQTPRASTSTQISAKASAPRSLRHQGRAVHHARRYDHHDMGRQGGDGRRASRHRARSGNLHTFTRGTGTSIAWRENTVLSVVDGGPAGAFLAHPCFEHSGKRTCDPSPRRCPQFDAAKVRGERRRRVGQWSSGPKITRWRRRGPWSRNDLTRNATARARRTRRIRSRSNRR